MEMTGDEVEVLAQDSAARLLYGETVRPPEDPAKRFWAIVTNRLRKRGLQTMREPYDLQFDEHQETCRLKRAVGLPELRAERERLEARLCEIDEIFEELEA